MNNKLTPLDRVLQTIISLICWGAIISITLMVYTCGH